MKVKFTLSIGFPGDHEDEFDLPDDMTDDQIQTEYLEWCGGFMDGGWEKVD